MIKETFNKNKKALVPMFAAVLVAGAGAGALSYANATHAADAIGQTSATQGASRPQRVKPAAVGEVTSISGNTITLTGKDKVAYTIDASSAKIMKMPEMVAGTKPTTRPTPTTITVADVKVGDTLMVEGTANGTSVVATTIMDGKFAGGRGFGGGPGEGGPHLGGTVTAVSGNTITVSETAKDGTVKTYTVDTATAKIHKTIDITSADIKVGDNLNVRGTLSGTTVTATDVMDAVK